MTSGGAQRVALAVLLILILSATTAAPQPEPMGGAQRVRIVEMPEQSIALDGPIQVEIVGQASEPVSLLFQGCAEHVVPEGFEFHLLGIHRLNNYGWPVIVQDIRFYVPLPSGEFEPASPLILSAGESVKLNMWDDGRCGSSDVIGLLVGEHVPFGVA